MESIKLLASMIPPMAGNLSMNNMLTKIIVLSPEKVARGLKRIETIQNLVICKTGR